MAYGRCCLRVENKWQSDENSKKDAAFEQQKNVFYAAKKDCRLKRKCVKCVYEQGGRLPERINPIDRTCPVCQSDWIPEITGMK